MQEIDKEWEIQLKQLQAELILMKDSIKETATDIMSEGFSDYPIFIAHQSPINIGEVILDKNDLATIWSISAATLEIFLDKKLVEREKSDFFKLNYKNPKEFMCLFVLYGNAARFVFVPYKTNFTEINPALN